MHPVLFTIGGFTLYSYGAVLLVSFLTGTAFSVHLGRKRGYNPDDVIELCMGALIAGIVGARLAYVIQNVPHYMSHPLSAFNLREGGMTVTGGLVLAVVWLLWTQRQRGVSVLNVVDFLSAPTLLGMALGRIGCLLHGCCFGEVCQLPWAITYPAGSLAPGFVLGPRHPSQVYEMLMDLVFMVFMLGRYGKTRFAGQQFYMFFVGYGIIRFLDELTRYSDTPMGPLNLYQWISLGFFSFGVAGLLGLFGRPPVQYGFLDIQGTPEWVDPAKPPQP